MKTGMTYIIPPLCDPTVPLLGPYQMAGYAESEGYQFEVIDCNVKFAEYIVNYAQKKDYKIEATSLDDLELLCCKLYIESNKEIDNYQSLLCKLRKCIDTDEYWKLVDYLRACYDYYSLQFDRIRFRIDGLDSCYHWNIWSEVEQLVRELENSKLYDLIANWVEDFGETETFGLNVTFDSQLAIALLFAKVIKKKFPDSVLCVGGGFVNSFIESADSMGPFSDFFDIVCNGEGEALIWHLNQYGVTKYKEIGCQIENTSAYYVTAGDLCSKQLMVFPPKIEKSELEKFFSSSKIIPLRFTYQCYWGKCKFCTDKEYHACLSSKYDYERMIEYCVQSVKTHSIDGVYFLDSAIPANVLKKFCMKIIETDCHVTWGTNSRFDKVFNDESFIKLLSDAGCKFIKFGLESGSQKVLDLMQKGTQIENAKEIINLCKKYGILVHAYVMFAYPGEEREDREKTIKFLLDDYSHPDNYNCSEFIMYGTSIVAKEMEYDFSIDIQKEEGWYSSSYSFTNDEIKMQIADLRTRFDEKYTPNNMLISTGHTISCANRLKNVNRRKIILHEDTVLKKNEYTVNAQFDTKDYIAVWRRRDCIVYITDNVVYKVLRLKDKITIHELMEMGITTNSIYDLINESFMYISYEGEGKILDFYGDKNIEIIYGNKFLPLKWYGYYDVG